MAFDPRKNGTTRAACQAVLFSILCSLFSVSFAAFSGDAKGTSAAQFLKLGAGARASGMGEAYSAVCEDADSVYWNPAALGGLRRHSGLFMHASLFAALNYEYLGYALPLKRGGGFGLGVQHLSFGSIARTDSSGFGTGSSMDPSQTAVSLAYGRKLDAFEVGAAAKYVRSRLAATASAFALDLGVLSPAFMADQMRLSFVVQNMGGGLKYDEKADPLPLNVRIGALLRLAPDLAVGLELDSPRDNRPHAALGGEYLVHYEKFTVAGRLGYNTRTAGDLDGLSGLSFGLGAGSGRWALDYAFSPFGDLGAAHRVSLGFRFETRSKVQKAEDALARSGGPDLLINDPDPGAFMPEYRGVKVSSDAYRNHLVQAEVLAALKNFRGAAASCRAAMALLPAGDPRRIYLLERQGWLALGDKDVLKAKRLYLEAIDTAKKLKVANRAVVNAYCGLAYCMEETKDYLAAQLNLNHALELTSNQKLMRDIERAQKRLRLLENR